MMGQGISQEMGHDVMSNMRDINRLHQAIGPNQYFKEDDMGNYVYAYDDQFTKKREEGNRHGDVEGQYAYTMPNGLQRQVAYVADNHGFHVRDNADPARIKRSTEPDLLQAKMTSVMDSSSLKADGRDMHRMSNLMGGDMSAQMDKNMMGIGQQKHSNIMMGRNMMNQDSMNSRRMGQDNIGRNMMGGNLMGRNIYNVMSNRGMTSDMFNMMGQRMGSSLIGRDMMGQDMTS